MRRPAVVLRILELVESTDLRVIDLATGWPSRLRATLSSGTAEIALFAGLYSARSYRDRDHLERRFQNPGQGHPITQEAGVVSVLVGLWEEAAPPLLVGHDVRPHAGLLTRKSFFVAVPALDRGLRSGWAEYEDQHGHGLVTLHPKLFLPYLEMVTYGLSGLGGRMEMAVEAAGLGLDPATGAGERARRAAMRLVRDSAFRRRVVAAYDGLCALCGLNSGLVEGAHIYPASAPSSPDETWNGLALCSNHHLAFDRHDVWIDPGTSDVKLSEALHSGVSSSAACARFVDSTFRRLAVPALATNAPRRDMFERRYQHFQGRYDWTT